MLVENESIRATLRDWGVNINSQGQVTEIKRSPLIPGQIRYLTADGRELLLPSDAHSLIQYLNKGLKIAPGQVPPFGKDKEAIARKGRELADSLARAKVEEDNVRAGLFKYCGIHFGSQEKIEEYIQEKHTAKPVAETALPGPKVAPQVKTKGKK